MAKWKNGVVNHELMNRGWRPSQWKNAVLSTTGEFEVPNSQQYAKDRIFKAFLTPLNQQGWKIHVPAPQSYVLSPNYKDLFIHLQTNRIPHKYVITRDTMCDMDKKGEQAGKFLTIYPDDERQLLVTTSRIDRVLEPSNFTYSPATQGDKQVGTRNKVSVRYGGLTSKVIVKPELLNVDGANKDAANYTKDLHVTYKPANIRDPFVPNSTGADGWIPKGDVRVRCTKYGRVQIFFKRSLISNAKLT